VASTRIVHSARVLVAAEVISDSTQRTGVDLLVRLVETAGALIIFLGALLAFGRFVLAGLTNRDAQDFVRVRLGLGRFLTLGLEFQLASDVLRTAVAPSFREIGQLAAIATIRTALNYFLAREIRSEKSQVDKPVPA
jgi:uncharacterized membrane protein